MQLARGMTLKEPGEHLSAEEKTSVGEQMCNMIQSLRQLKPEISDQLIRILCVISENKDTSDIPDLSYRIR
jgi:hypothetical protein